MTAKEFAEILRNLIEAEEFVVDESTMSGVDLEEIKTQSENEGFDEIIVVAGNNSDEVFTLQIKKVE